MATNEQPRPPTSFDLRMLLFTMGDLDHPHVTVDTGGRTNGQILRRLKALMADWAAADNKSTEG